MAKTTDIVKLAQRVKDAKDAYYGGGQPLMDDATYDALEDELRRLDPSNPVLAIVGAAPIAGGGWPKVKHEIPMGSLQKSQDESDLDKWFSSRGIQPLTDLCVSDKLDGISIGLRYEKGKLVQGLTRGDGDEGEDITRNVLLMKGALKQLPKTIAGKTLPDVVYVRGEVVILKSDFADHFRGESNPRNSASGTSKRQSDPTKCKYLTIKAYQWLPDGMAPASKSDEFKALEEAGFITARWQVVTTKSGVMALYQDYVDTIRDGLDYLIDGLVLDINDRDVREGKGTTDGRPKGAVAFKFPHDKKPTTLRAIRWQVGSSGRITPVAEFDTVNLAGANVSQASLHNISNIADLAANVGQEFLFKGDKILVARRNDVIPYVEEVLEAANDADIDDDDAFKTPTECPSCKAKLERDGEYLVCRNEDCEAQATGAIKRWCKKIDVKHVGDSLIECLVDEGLVTDIADLYTLDPNEVENLTMGTRRVGGTGRKAITNLRNKMALPLHVFVGSLGIPLIGRSMAKTIVDGGFDTLSKMLKARIADIAAIPGVGQSKAESFCKGFLAKAGLIAKLISVGIVVQVASGPLKGTVFCLTGFRDGDLTEAIEKAGGTVKSSVSKALTHLVLKDPTSNSGKAKKARDYNKAGTADIKLIDPDEAWVLAGGRP